MHAGALYGRFVRKTGKKTAENMPMKPINALISEKKLIFFEITVNLSKKRL